MEYLENQYTIDVARAPVPHTGPAPLRKLSFFTLWRVKGSFVYFHAHSLLSPIILNKKVSKSLSSFGISNDPSFSNSDGKTLSCLKFDIVKVTVIISF